MALSSCYCPLGLTLVLLFSLAFHPSQSVSLRIGSRPPGCVNKCMSCQPCKATIVISGSHKNNKGVSNSNTDPSKRQADDTYYLLSWKCRCRDHLFQP